MGVRGGWFEGPNGMWLMLLTCVIPWIVYFLGMSLLHYKTWSIAGLGVILLVHGLMVLYTFVT